MPRTIVDGLSLAYEVIGELRDGGRTWAITPGGRFSKDDPGIKELAQALAEKGHSVLVWDRPNTGDSDVCIAGESESEMQADALAGLLRQLDLAPAIIIGGSGGSRVSLLTVARHRDAAAGLAVWWISGGVFGLMSIGVHYCGANITAAWNGGMEAVVELPEWQEVLSRTPSNRQRLLDLDPKEFVATMERWMHVYSPRDGELVPGLLDRDARALDLPALVFRSGVSDLHHRRETSEGVAALLPASRLVEPPWPDTEWNDRHTPEARAEGLFVHWPLLAPQLLAWADETVA